jgi:hypothetical protein
MKMKTILMCVLAFTLVFTLFGSLMNDMQQQYPEEAIDSTYWDKYGENGSLNFASQIQSRGSLLAGSLKTLSSGETAWYSKIALGIMAIPYAVLDAIIYTIDGMDYANALLTEVMEDIGVPPAVVYIFYVGLIITIVFAIISFLQRHPA